jgi:NAD(P)-dependent dehydrogenase (short-subunit alcohol dehydrogenase family)
LAKLPDRTSWKQAVAALSPQGQPAGTIQPRLKGAYGIAKAGLLMLVRHMALEWGPDGIRVNSVSPGPTLTGLTEGVFNDLSDPKQKAVREMREAKLPLRKLGTPEEVAAAIMFLASPAASQITGIDILVDGGMSTILMPSAGVSTGQS